MIFKLADYPLIIKPSLWGKWTTTLQVATVILVLMGKAWHVPRELLLVFFWLTGGLTAISGIHYVCRGLKHVGQSPGNGPEKAGHG
jgi:phosphatidylglycerophosphate synthase